MRTDVVYLPIGEAKCAPQSPCSQSALCARTRVSAEPGRPLADFSGTYVWLQGACSKSLAASKHHAPPAVEPKAAHEYMKGLL